MIWGKHGNYYSVEYTVKGSIEMWTYTHHTTDHRKVEEQVKAAINRVYGYGVDNIEIYQMVRLAK